MRAPSAAVALGMLLLLGGCGQRETLKPVEGHAMPPKPKTSPAPRTVDQMLTPPVQTRPGRSDDALLKSQERPDDRFDLPPPG